MIKLIESTHYHLWTDALHGRSLARQARNDWDRGTYVRWTVQSAWSAFEMVSGDVLAASGLGMRFKERFDEAIANKGITAVDWGKGLWQKVLHVYGDRKEFTHVQPTISQSKLLAPVEMADGAIRILRDAIKEVCRLAGVPGPIWVDDDSDRGWDKGGTFAHGTLIRAGADPDGPDTIKLAYVSWLMSSVAKSMSATSCCLERPQGLCLKT
jgi:hypothetical protein